jgi:hypothetical protein
MTMPEDPFVPVDFARLGRAVNALFAGQVNAGMAEAYALEITCRVTVALILNAVQQAPQNPPQPDVPGE